MSLHKKLFEIQGTVEALTKDTKGYNYKYFDINQMLEKLKPLFQKHNLLILQPLEDDRVYTRIIDLDSEEVAESSLALTIGAKPQDLGSEVTYYRRYTLQSLLGLQAEDDDASKTNNAGYAQGGAKKKLVEGSTDWKNVVMALKDGYTLADIKKKYNVPVDLEKKLIEI